MNLRSILAPIVILLSVLGTAQGAIYYVATSGSDSNPGTQSAPFRHLSKASLTAKQPGDTVIVMDGEDKMRLLITELDHGMPVRYIRQSLTRVN